MLWAMHSCCGKLTLRRSTCAHKCRNVLKADQNCARNISEPGCAAQVGGLARRWVKQSCEVDPIWQISDKIRLECTPSKQEQNIKTVKLPQNSTEVRLKLTRFCRKPCRDDDFQTRSEDLLFVLLIRTVHFHFYRVESALEGCRTKHGTASVACTHQVSCKNLILCNLLFLCCPQTALSGNEICPAPLLLGRKVEF